MFAINPNCLLRLPRLQFLAAFTQVSLDDTATYYIVQFERVDGLDQPDQYYVAVLDINAPVISSDVKATFAAALVWDCAPTPVVLARKISAWLGEAL